MYNATEQKKFKRRGSSDFLVRIHFRQHASWQGEVEWLGKKDVQKRFFRSLFELICLMSETMESTKCPPSTYKLRNWDRMVEGEELE